MGFLFQLKRSNGVWNEQVIHQFSENGGDGFEPEGVYLDRTSGALYVTTGGGGANRAGTVKQFVWSGGTWTQTILYSFTGSPDGALPHARVIEDKSTGTLFGTTYRGGTHGQSRGGLGTVFQITP